MGRRRKKQQVDTAKPLANCSKPMPGDAEIMHALNECGGVVLRAADMLGVSRCWLSRKVNGNPELNKARQEASVYILDAAEASLLKLVEDGDPKATVYALRCRGYGRGWLAVERKEVTGAGGTPVQVEHTVDPAFVDELVREVFGGPTSGGDP